MKYMYRCHVNVIYITYKILIKIFRRVLISISTQHIATIIKIVIFIYNS
jgi:hypothetical protein